LDDPGIQAAVGIAVGVVVGAIFTALSVGLEALGELRLRAVAEAGGPLASLARRVLDHGSEIRSRLLVARIGCLTVSAALAAAIESPRFPALGGAGAVVAVALAYAVFAQVAGAIAIRRPAEVVLRAYRILRPFELLMAPVVMPLLLIDRVVGRLAPPPRERPYAAERLTELAVEQLLEQGEEEGSIAEEQAQLLWNVLEFKNTVAREIMVPRTQIVAFDIETEFEEVLAQIIEHGHSRYVVYRKTIDQVEGVLYAKDLFRAFRDDQHLDGIRLVDLVRPALFVPEGQKIGTVLREMQARHFHMAVVTDEFGGVAGLVTLEDIVEEIVGEIQDEHDEEEPMIRALEDGRFEANAGISVYDLAEFLGEPLHHDSGDFDSLGGLVVQLAGRVPAPGECVRAGRFELCVREADDRRVTKVEIVPVVEAAEPLAS
jgi:CBS domain containing-hemolysin-like protein